MECRDVSLSTDQDCPRMGIKDGQLSVVSYDPFPCMLKECVSKIPKSLPNSDDGSSVVSIILYILILWVGGRFGNF